MSANNQQIGGAHYSNTKGVQHWDFVATALKGRYFEGNITKYVSRYKLKNGAEDLRKAVHYVEKLAELFVSGGVETMRLTGDASYPNMLQAFITSAGLDFWQSQVMVRAAMWRTAQDLKELRGIINNILQECLSERDAWGDKPDDESLHAREDVQP